MVPDEIAFYCLLDPYPHWFKTIWCVSNLIRAVGVVYLMCSVEAKYARLTKCKANLPSFVCMSLSRRAYVLLTVSHVHYLTSCSVRLSLRSRVLTAVHSCCMSLSGRVSSPRGKGSSSFPMPNPALHSAGSRLVGWQGSLEEGRDEQRLHHKHVFPASRCSPLVESHHCLRWLAII